MIWVAWRHHRVSVITALSVIAAFAGLMLFMRLTSNGTMSDLGAMDCLSDAGSCPSEKSMAALQTYGAYLSLMPIALFLLPILLGALLGAPVFARELSTGAHVFSLTQATSRRRWWATKLTVTLLPVCIAIAGLGMFAMWALRPMIDIIDSPMRPGNFEAQGIVMVGYLALSFAVAATMGLLTRNSVVPIVVTIAVCGVIMFTTIIALRPSYMPTQDVRVENSEKSKVPENAWHVDESMELSNGDVADSWSAACDGLGNCEGEVAATIYDYHPADRFWTFQGMETGMFVGLAAAAIAVGNRGLRTRLP